MITDQHITITPETRPQRRNGIDEHRLNDEAVLYDVAHHATHYVNTTACFIWSRCDGRHNIEDITNGVLDEFEMNDPGVRSTVRQDVETTVIELVRNGLVGLTTDEC